MVVTQPMGNALPQLRKSYSRIADVLSMPHLIDIQVESFRRFREEGLRETLAEFSPIHDFTGARLELRFGHYSFGEPKHSMEECRQRDLSYTAPLTVQVELVIKETGEVKEQKLFFGDFPLMTPTGTFIINGAERVVVSQLMRSPGAYFTLETDPTSGRDLCMGKLIPNRGAWLEFESSNKDVLYVKVDRRRKLPATMLLRAADEEPGLSERALGTNERILQLFTQVDDHPEHHYIQATLERDPSPNKVEAIQELYHRMRPGDLPTMESARSLVNALFFNPRRYDLGAVGRYKVNKRLGLAIPSELRTLTLQDLVAFIKHMILLNNGHLHTGLPSCDLCGRPNSGPDDIDHLGNRRIRPVGELIQNAFRVGLLRMERAVRERMSITDPDQATPSALTNIRPVVAAIREFFGASQLSQFMDQTNPLAELTHKRRVSALGPGGLSRERAGFEVRDVHHSHYGRICPIETPEGPNIGLIGSLATFGRLNRYGFIETPYRRVLRELESTSPLLQGRILRQDIHDEGRPVARAGDPITEELAHWLASQPPQAILIQPFVSTEIHYLPADEEEEYVIAQANTPVDAEGHFLTDKVECRLQSSFLIEPPERVDFMDVSPKQVFSVAASLIPFLEHDDANRALMGSNMQRQAVPLLRPQAPLVATGIEERVAQDSGQVLVAPGPGTVLSVTGNSIRVRYEDGQVVEHRLIKFMRSNQGTCINQRPAVSKGQQLQGGQVLADSSSTAQGQLALGQDLLCAFMSWEGYNYEDAVIVADTIAREDKFSSLHIEKYEVEARDTKLGPEEITRDIPNVGEEALRNLDEEGIIRIGAEVRAGDILVGKITPKGETELTAEEKLLRAIFGEKARDVKDTSLRVPHGERGKVIDVKVYRRQEYPEMPAGVQRMVRVQVAQQRKVSVGDKMAARHGNKGVIARMVPVEDMPYLPDGTPIEVILNPIGVPSRMNLGQVLETHLGWAAYQLGFQAISPIFDGGDDKTIKDDLGRAWIAYQAGALLAEADPSRGDGYGERLDWERVRAWLAERGYDAPRVFDHREVGYAQRACLEIWLAEEMGLAQVRGLPLEELEALADGCFRERGAAPPILGKQTLYDGRTGEPFRQPVTVGHIYLIKLVHLVEDKIHARSTGPYSLITQQPLGGKAQFGGQRFGEMEVWALEAYGAAHILQEMLTVKSDDVVGRVKTYEAIVKGEDIQELGVPESFKVLVKELQSLGLTVEVLNEEEEKIALPEETEEIPHLGVNLSGFEKEEEFFGA